MEAEEKDNGFNWTSLFLVTGISCLLFSAVLTILDETSILFWRIGLVSTGLGFLSFLNQWLGKIISPGKPQITTEQD